MIRKRPGAASRPDPHPTIKIWQEDVLHNKRDSCTDSKHPKAPCQGASESKRFADSIELKISLQNSEPFEGF